MLQKFATLNPGCLNRDKSDDNKQTPSHPANDRRHHPSRSDYFHQVLFITSIANMPGLRTRASRATGPSEISETRRAASAPTIDIPEEPLQTDLRVQICQVFHSAQKSAATQRKSCISLRRIQEACCFDETKGQKQRVQGTEADFKAEFWRCAIRALGVRRGEAVGDRTVRFVGLFLAHAEEKDNARLSEGRADDGEYGVEDTPTGSLTTFVIHKVAPLMQSKEKIVRYRACQLVAEIINSISSIDDDAFDLARMGFLRAMRDKESYIRVQAVIGLGKLVGDGAGEDAEEEQDETEYGETDTSSGLMPRLLDLLQNDQSADVRKTLLMNLPVTPATLPFLLERARDQDAVTRRALYSRLLPRIGDFRHLTLAMREKLLRWGLRDRDPQVRNAAEKLFYEQWISDCSAPSDPESPDPSAGSFDITALLELIERIGIIYSGAEGGIALEAMKAFWTGRPDYRQQITFSDTFWDSLTGESAFMLRSFSDYCHAAALDDSNAQILTLLEERLPEVTKFAFYLEHYANTLVDSLKLLETRSEEERELAAEDEELVLEQEFIVEQLLHVAQRLDFSDEIGRRKMFALLREMLAVPELTDGIRKLVIECLKATTGTDAAGERDFCGVIVEAIAEIHDTLIPAPEQDGDQDQDQDVDESFHSAQSDLSSSQQPDQKRQAPKPKTYITASADNSTTDAMAELLVNLKCLSIAQTTLTLISSDLQTNTHLLTLLHNLIIPAVRSYEAPLREQGLICLGLCCLLDLALARENLGLFQHCFLKGSEALQGKSLEVLTDMLLVWQTSAGIAAGRSLFSTELPSTEGPTKSADAASAGPTERDILKMYAKALRSAEKPALQATAATSLAKLLLAQVIPSPLPPDSSTTRTNPTEEATTSLLHLLLKTYFLPSTPSNPALLQSLAYFLPIYAHSSLTNQLRLAGVCVPVLRSLWTLREERDLDCAGSGSDGGFGGGGGDEGVRGEGEMVRAGVMAGMVGEWCDGRRVYVPKTGGFTSTVTSTESEGVGCGAHLRLARDILERLRSGSGLGREERKMWCAMVGKLHFSLPAPLSNANRGLGNGILDRQQSEERETLERQGYYEVLDLFRDVMAGFGPGVEAASRNALNKACVGLERVVKKMEEHRGGSQLDGARGVGVGGEEDGGASGRITAGWGQRGRSG